MFRCLSRNLVHRKFGYIYKYLNRSYCLLSFFRFYYQKSSKTNLHMTLAAKSDSFSTQCTSVAIAPLPPHCQVSMQLIHFYHLNWYKLISVTEMVAKHSVRDALDHSVSPSDITPASIPLQGNVSFTSWPLRIPSRGNISRYNDVAITQTLKLVIDNLVLMFMHFLKSYNNVTKVTCRLLYNFIDPNTADHPSFMLVLNLSVLDLLWICFPYPFPLLYLFLAHECSLAKEQAYVHQSHKLFLVHLLFQSMCDYACVYDQLARRWFDMIWYLIRILI